MRESPIPHTPAPAPSAPDVTPSDLATTHGAHVEKGTADPRTRLVKKGDWNHAIIVLGVPGTGKSTYACQRALELGRTPAYVLAHDPGWRLPAELPDGSVTPLTRHDSIAAGQAALARSPAGIHAFAVADGEEVLLFGVQVAQASLAANGGQAGVPVVVLLDEGVGTGAASPYRLGEALRQGMALRRHQHTAIILTAQDPRLIHYAMVGLATELVVFRLNDRAALAELVRMGMPPADVAKVATLAPFESVTLKLS